MCPPVFSFVDVPRGSAAWEERVSQPIMDFCPSQPTRRLSRLSLQGAFLVDNFNYGDRIIRWIVSSVAGAPMVMMLNIAGKRGPAASASARPGPPPSACNPDRPAGFRPAGPCTCQMERCRRSRRGLRLASALLGEPVRRGALRRASTRGGFHLTASPSQCAKSPAHVGHKSASVWGRRSCCRQAASGDQPTP